MRRQNIIREMYSFLKRSQDKIDNIIENFCANKMFVRILFFRIIILTGVVIYKFNVHTPLLADDYGYRYSRVTHLPIAS